MPLLPDGSLLGCGIVPGVTLNTPGAPDNSLQGRHGNAIRVVRLRAESSGIDSLGVLGPGDFYTLTSGEYLTGVTHPFEPKGYLEVGLNPTRVFIANNRDYSIEVWDLDGRLLRTIRRLGASRTPTPEERSLAMDEVASSVDDMFIQQARSLVEEPATIPEVFGLVGGSDGEIWVRREPYLESGTRTVFDVFDGEGAYVGEVVIPAVLNVHEAGESYVLGVREDEMGVPFVEMYGLTRE
jgi:hypothetical protein